MGERQNSLQVEILKAGYEDIKQTVMLGLDSKSRFIQAQYQRELSESSVKRINIEFEHIKNCIGLIDAFENLIEQLEKEVNVLRLKTSFAFDESKDYMEKYYSTMLSVNKSIQEANELKKSNFRQG